MPAANQLSHAGIMIALRQKNRRINGVFFTLIISTLPDSNVPKIACIVSRKVSTKAVVRNRIKRHCREAVRPLLLTIPGAVFLFYAQKNSKEVSFEEIRKDIYSLLGIYGVVSL